MSLTIVAFDREGLATDDPRKAWSFEWINEAGNTVHAEERRRDRTFTLRVEADLRDGGYVASVDELPGCVSRGETQQEAITNIADAILCVLEVRVEG